MASNPSLGTQGNDFHSSIDAENKYKEIISTLPICSSDPVLRLYKGFWYGIEMLEPLLSIEDHFKAQSSDIFLCSFPKTGSTWLKALAFAIATRTRYKDEDSSNPFLTKSPQQLFKCLDLGKFNACDPDLPIMSTHIPYAGLPPSIISSNSKLVYICRDPKDVLISGYHFAKKLHEGTQIQLNDVYEFLCKGHWHCGPYWDHVLGFWKASLENHEKVLFLKYEEMKKDTQYYVKRLADFMGYPFSPEEERSGEVEKIVRMCSVENLKNLEANKTGNISGLFGKVDLSAFVRKGEVGDWKNHLSKEMAEHINQIFEEKLSPFGLTLCA